MHHWRSKNMLEWNCWLNVSASKFAFPTGSVIQIFVASSLSAGYCSISLLRLITLMISPTTASGKDSLLKFGPSWPKCVSRPRLVKPSCNPTLPGAPPAFRRRRSVSRLPPWWPHSAKGVCPSFRARSLSLCCTGHDPG